MVDQEDYLGRCPPRLTTEKWVWCNRARLPAAAANPMDDVDITNGVQRSREVQGVDI